MIKIEQLNKYFFRRKSNEIHVINDITLELPEKGLVVLLGPSGSGKTTLLNVLGGLDRPQSGMINFDGDEIKRYKSHVWDKIRNRKIGYIFQNYNLLTELTVYENIEIALNMSGITDKSEIDKRVDYILEHIGMMNYRKRRASQLSGGQQQRVAIARALAKNPKVIIADEPTGNLDSKNSLDIMNIIKSISKEKLVVLVTHEQELADFYADRVIRLEDGVVISDETNNSKGDLEYRHESDIYLKDLHQYADINDVGSNISIYSDEEIDPKFDIKIVIKNKTVYLDVVNKEYPKKKLLDSDSEVRLLDKHYEKVSVSNIETSEFNLDDIVDDSKVDRKKSVISVKESIIFAFKKILGTKMLGRILYLGFFLIAGLIALAVGMIFSIYTVEPESYLATNSKDSVTIAYDVDDSYSDFLKHEEDDSINYMIINRNQHNISFKVPGVFQAREIYNQLGMTPALVDYMDGDKVFGRNVEAPNEIVLDKYIANNLIGRSSFRHIGIDSFSDLLELEIEVKLAGVYGEVLYTLKVVGIYETKSPTYYAMESTVYMMETGIPILEAFEDQITISGATPSELDEVLVLNNPADTRLLSNILYFNEFDTNGKTATGKYTSSNPLIPTSLVPLDTVKEDLFNAYYTSDNLEVIYHANDYEAVKAYFEDAEIPSAVASIDTYNEYRAYKLSNSIGTIIFAVIVITSASISYFLVIRSSLLSRIYEISVYRALGASKVDIIKIFMTEILVITTFISVPGFFISSFMMLKAQDTAGGFIDFYHMSFISVVVGLAIIYLVNLISGLFPISNLLRKTPSEILSKYDF